MQNLSNISVIRDLLTRYGFTFSKALGQNFLINPSVCPRMAELGGAAPGTGMIEIGAGIGVDHCRAGQAGLTMWSAWRSTAPASPFWTRPGRF